MTTQPLKIVQNSEKQMPCNIEAEQALIGSILISNDIFDEITSIIDSKKFFDPIHAKIFETIEILISKEAFFWSKYYRKKSIDKYKHPRKLYFHNRLEHSI